MFSDLQIKLLEQAVGKFGYQSTLVTEYIQANLRIVDAREYLEKLRRQLEAEYQQNLKRLSLELLTLQETCPHVLTFTERADSYEPSYTTCQICHKEL